MKQSAFLLAVIFLLAAGARAQANSDNSLPLSAAASASGAAASPATATPSLFAVEAAPALGAPSVPGTSASAPGPLGSKTTDQQPSVYGVFQNYNWQVSAGYTFFRLYIVPGTTENMNGLNIGMVYYPGGKWIGPEGEFIGTWGNVIRQSSKYVQGMGGVRFRWSAPLGLEVWGHGMVGGSNLLPQTSFGSQGAFAYAVGGGVDFNIHQKRFAYRAGADMVGTRFFNTYQYSPQVSISFVYKF